MRTERTIEYEVLWLNTLERLIEDLSITLGSRRGLLVSTPTVAVLYAKAIVQSLKSLGSDVELEVIPCSEETKTLGSVERLCERATKLRLDRSAVLISLSGGVCSDLVTLAASLLRRGLHHIRIPTTLLGMVDAGVGAKGAVNFAGEKNHLGCFHAPERVYVCPEFLTTLPTALLRAGASEMAKVAIAADADLFRLLEQHGSTLIDKQFQTPSDLAHHIIWTSISGLLDELRPNLFEDQSLVRSMDFGHTFSPRLEIASEYRLSHGEAVAVDMALSNALAVELGWLSEACAARLTGLLRRLGLPCHSDLIDLGFLRASIASSIRHRGGSLNLFLPTGIGESRCLSLAEPLTDAVLVRALERVALWAS
jgi:3-dehydroquinate synthase